MKHIVGLSEVPSDPLMECAHYTPNREIRSGLVRRHGEDCGTVSLLKIRASDVSCMQRLNERFGDPKMSVLSLVEYSDIMQDAELMC